MTSLLVPLTMVVIGHHIDPVKVGGNLSNIIAHIHDGLARAHSSTQQQTLGLEGS